MLIGPWQEEEEEEEMDMTVGSCLDSHYPQTFNVRKPRFFLLIVNEINRKLEMYCKN